MNQLVASLSLCWIIRTIIWRCFSVYFSLPLSTWWKKARATNGLIMLAAWKERWALWLAR